MDDAQNAAANDFRTNGDACTYSLYLLCVEPLERTRGGMFVCHLWGKRNRDNASCINLIISVSSLQLNHRGAQLVLSFVELYNPYKRQHIL